MGVTSSAAETAPSPADYSACVHCGLCLEHCPTYVSTGLETASPRGRLHLIAALNEGRIEISDTYTQAIDECLACRACEAACPSGVPFGRVMEAARTQVRNRVTPTRLHRAVEWLVFEQMLPHPGRIQRLGRLLRAYERSGLQRLVRGSGLLHVLAPALADAEQMLPSIPRRFFHPRWDFFPAVGAPRARVGLFTGCVMPVLFPAVHRATVRVLTYNGCDVYLPPDQVCCGALNVHSGERQRAGGMAAANLDAFEVLPLDAIVVNSAGCGSTLKEYAELLDSPRAATFARKVMDVHELLAALPLRPPAGEVRRRVTLQESCHLVHAQRISAQPRAILAAIPGLDLVDMAHSDRCCGSAGSYAITHPEMSLGLLDEKMGEVRATSADTIATANPSCLLQLQVGVRRAGLSVDVKHVIELVDESYARGKRSSGRVWR